MIKKKRIIQPAPPTVKKKVKSITPTAMEYIQLFNSCEIKKNKIAEVDKIIDEKIVVNRSRYEGISNLVRSGGKTSTVFNTPIFFQPLYTLLSNRPFPTQPLNDTLKVDQLDLQKPWAGLYPGKTYDLLQGKYVDNNSPMALDKDFFSETSYYNSSAVPWYFIACVHYLECSFSFKHHLHNGDPLTAYTVHVPAHRPKVAHGPPFTFEESAVDAIKLMKYDQVTNWSLPYILLKLEGYNGFGYSKRGLHSPYLWSYSNHYEKGKYVKDGVFDASAVSTQLGAAVILKRMEDRALISIPRN